VFEVWCGGVVVFCVSAVCMCGCVGVWVWCGVYVYVSMSVCVMCTCLCVDVTRSVNRVNTDVLQDLPESSRGQCKVCGPE